ncbi:diacylglycerol kinase zeta-like isoform X6 [Lates japonicus]
MRPLELNIPSVMDLDLGVDADLGHGAELETCGGTTEEKSLETERHGEGDGLLNLKGDDGEFSSASSSSNYSLPSSSTLPPSSSSPPPICVEEEKEMLTGCSKSFTGLKLFSRR